MKRGWKINKKIFAFSFVSFIFLIPLIYADTSSTDDTYKTCNGFCFKLEHNHGNDLNRFGINGVCKDIKNSDPSIDYFMPFNSAAEINAFIQNHPDSISITDCASTCYSAGQQGCLNDRSKSCCSGLTCQGTGQGTCAPPATTSVTGCTKCADEGGTCSFSGTYGVIYGSGTTFYSKSLSGGTACTNSVFGDPTPGTVKACYICSTITTDIENHRSSTPVPTCSICSQGTPIPITSSLWMAVETSAVAYQQAQAAGSTQPDAQAIADAAAAAAKANPTSSPTAGAGVGLIKIASGSFSYGGHTYTVVTYSSGETIVYRDNLNGLSTTNTGIYVQQSNGQWGYIDTSGQVHDLNANTGDPNSQNFDNSANTIQNSNNKIIPLDPAIPHGAIAGESAGTTTSTPDPAIPHGAKVGEGPGVETPTKTTTTPTTGSACFLAGTKVLMADGSSKNIEEVKVGDKVLSYNYTSDVFTTSIVKTLIIHDGKKDVLNDFVKYPLIKLSVKVGNKLIITEVTLNHRFYDPTDKIFKQLKDFKLGDELKTINGLGIITNEKLLINTNSQTVVYNLEMANGPKDYLANGIVVHNKKSQQ